MKDKTAYDVYIEKAEKIADALPAPPNEISQAVLWLKAGASKKIDDLKDPALVTFKKGDKFGFTEKYVNLLMHYAYERGRTDGKISAESAYKARSAKLEKAMEAIVDALDDNGLLPDNEY